MHSLKKIMTLLSPSGKYIILKVRSIGDPFPFTC